MKVKISISLCLMLIVYSLSTLAQGQKNSVSDCAKLMVPSKYEVSKLASYLTELLASQLISVTELKMMLSSMQTGRIENPITKATANLSLSAKIHHQNLEQHLRNPNLDRKALSVWLAGEIDKLDKNHRDRSVVEEETFSPFRKINFLPLKAREVTTSISENYEVLEQTFVHQFEMSDIPVTQHQWFELMGYNPSRYTEGEDFYYLDKYGRSIKINPDNPVEFVSWWSAMEFANKLSRLHGYSEAYSFKKCALEKSPYGDGNLIVPTDNSCEIVINAPGGNLYKAEGYRLPTAAEVEIMLKGSDITLQGLDEYNDYGWPMSDKGAKTHPVAEKKAWKIDGQDFYDLVASMDFWGAGWPFKYDEGSASNTVWRHSPETFGYIPPHKSQLKNPFQALKRIPVRQNSFDAHIGLRLVRSLL